MLSLAERVDLLASEIRFSGVVSVDRAGEVEFSNAYGLAHRAHRIPNTLDTRFGIASATKGLTALTVATLIEGGALSLSTTARSVLDQDLPLIDDTVTIEHLLGHRSGIGDYLDEEAGFDPTAYVMPVPVHELASTEQYLAVLTGHRAKFAPDERFSYCNAGYVVLALIAERVTGTAFHELIRERVCEPAGMRDSAFLRSDELPERPGHHAGRRRQHPPPRQHRPDTALAQAGKPERAVAQLWQAAEQLQDCGAHRYRAATEFELRRLGQRIHRRTRSGDLHRSGVTDIPRT